MTNPANIGTGTGCKRNSNRVTTPLVADAYGLTRREREVVRLLASGHSRPEIAVSLHLSPHTVDDHVKRVFGKLDVHSRSELTYRLFLDQHAPRIRDGVPVGGSGWFLR